MLFGLKIFQDIFQMCMDQVMDHVAGIIALHSDIHVYGQTPEEHDWHLLQLMLMASQHGIIFNNSKCWIRQPQISLYGAVFTAKGMQPNPSKTSPPLIPLLNLSPFWD